MKIESLGKPVGPAPATATGARLRPSSATPASGEKVQLSPLSASLQKADAALAETPTIDRARITEIKQAIRDGHFKIDANRIADGLIADVRQMLESQAGRA